MRDQRRIETETEKEIDKKNAKTDIDRDIKVEIQVMTSRRGERPSKEKTDG